MSNLLDAQHLLGQYDPPTLGVNVVLPAHRLPANALVDSRNVMTRLGVLRTRPGFRSDGLTGDIQGSPLGVAEYVQTAEFGGATVPVLATTTRVYAGSGGAWIDITGSPSLSADLVNPVRFATMAVGTPLVNYLFLVNGVDRPRLWNGDLTGSFVDAIGDPPVFSDVCNIQDYIIGIEPPYGVQWCNLRDLTVWSALNRAERGESPDPVVAISPIGQGSSAVLYKHRSLWGVDFNQGATSDATAFRFYFIGAFEGPASPSAVIDVDGGHLYMTDTGRIGLFTGSTHVWIGDGIWPLVRDRINTNQADRVWGVYDPTYHEAYFVYPDKTDSDQMTGVVIVTLPMPTAGVTEAGLFPAQFRSELTAGAFVRSDATGLDQILVAGPATATTGASFELTTDVKTDNGQAFSGYWRTGLTFKRDPWRIEGVEVFADRGAGYGALTIRPVTSFSLNGNGTLGAPFIGAAGDLGAVDEPVRPVTGFDARTRFIGLQFDFEDSRTITLRYKGALIFLLKKA